MLKLETTVRIRAFSLEDNLDFMSLPNNIWVKSFLRNESWPPL